MLTGGHTAMSRMTLRAAAVAASLFLVAANSISVFAATTQVSITGSRWHINGAVTNPGSPAEGLLMNVRMVNATFDDATDATCPRGFDPDANTAAFIARVPD